MKKSFEVGEVVYCEFEVVVLVTGPGKRNEGYSCFSGVVVASFDKGEKEQLEVWPVGMYSKTWSTRAFKIIDINLTELIKSQLK